MDSLFLLTTVPGEIVGPVATGLGVAIVSLYRRAITLEERAQTNLKESLDAMHNATDSARAAVSAIDRLTDRVAAMERKLPGPTP